MNFQDFLVVLKVEATIFWNFSKRTAFIKIRFILIYSVWLSQINIVDCMDENVNIFESDALFR